MNYFHPLFTDIRSFTAYKFSQLRMRALRDSLLAKLIGKDISLTIFPEPARLKTPNRKLLGVKDILVTEIIGTLGRCEDFDHQFRPLKKYMNDRWVNTYISLEREEWSPILVHKIGNRYYVEDGHHRVSVAKSIGMAYIEANVWEYVPSKEKQESGHTIECAQMQPTKAYASR